MPAPIHSPAQARFQRLLTRYLELNRRNATDLVTQKAKRASVAFYKATKDAAPSKEKIKQDVLALGWKVKRPKGAWPLKKGEKRGSKGPLNRMRAAAIGRRQKAIGLVASGWLPAMDKLGAKGGAKDAANFRRPQGSVEVVNAGSANPGIVIVNSTPGIVAVEKKHGIIRQGLDEVSRDIIPYIRRKQQQTRSELQR